METKPRALPKRQAEILAYLRTHKPPTIQELATFLDVSRECARQHLARLEKKKFVCVAPGIPRGITVLP
jgi:predicted ArsR family transcriptional regulator